MLPDTHKFIKSIFYWEISDVLTSLKASSIIEKVKIQKKWQQALQKLEQINMKGTEIWVRDKMKNTKKKKKKVSAVGGWQKIPLKKVFSSGNFYQSLDHNYNVTFIVCKPLSDCCSVFDSPFPCTVVLLLLLFSFFFYFFFYKKGGWFYSFSESVFILPKCL